MKKYLILAFISLATISWSNEMDSNLKNEEIKTRITKAYNVLNANTLYTLDDFYDKAVYFEDPISKTNGLSDLKAYYAKMYKNVKSISFDFSDFIIQDQAVIAIWTMTLRAKGLNGGDPIKVVGNSHLKFSPTSNKVIYHRDYFDVGSMIYEHVPVLGFVIKKTKKVLAQ